jgi:hypothetical protein
MEDKHHAGVVIWRRNDATNRLEVLVMNVTSTYPDPRTGGQKTSGPHVKFVGGMQRLPDDSFEVSVTREIVEETYLRYSGPIQEIGDPIPVRDWNDQSIVDHVKRCALVPFTECSGEMRKDWLTDGNDKMSPPYWLPLDEVGRELYRTHQPFLMAAREALAFS